MRYGRNRTKAEIAACLFDQKAALGLADEMDRNEITLVEKRKNKHGAEIIGITASGRDVLMIRNGLVSVLGNHKVCQATFADPDYPLERASASERPDEKDMAVHGRLLKELFPDLSECAGRLVPEFKPLDVPIIGEDGERKMVRYLPTRVDIDALIRPVARFVKHPAIPQSGVQRDPPKAVAPSPKPQVPTPPQRQVSPPQASRPVSMPTLSTHFGPPKSQPSRPSAPSFDWTVQSVLRAQGNDFEFTVDSYLTEVAETAMERLLEKHNKDVAYLSKRGVSMEKDGRPALRHISLFSEFERLIGSGALRDYSACRMDIKLGRNVPEPSHGFPKKCNVGVHMEKNPDGTTDYVIVVAVPKPSKA